MRRRCHNTDFVPCGSEPVGHLARIFSDSGSFGMEINSVYENTHALCLRCENQQTIAATALVSQPQNWEEHKSSKQHKAKGMKRVSQLAILLILGRKRIRDRRLCNP